MHVGKYKCLCNTVQRSEVNIRSLPLLHSTLCSTLHCEQGLSELGQLAAISTCKLKGSLPVVHLFTSSPLLWLQIHADTEPSFQELRISCLHSKHFIQSHHPSSWNCTFKEHSCYQIGTFFKKCIRSLKEIDLKINIKKYLKGNAKLGVLIHAIISAHGTLR